MNPSFSSTDECGMSDLTPAALKLMADFFKVLSETSRLQIICSLKYGAKNVTEIIDATNLGQANVSKHLKVLTQAGIVARQQQGVSAYYEIANPLIFELCGIVCNSLVEKFELQNKPLLELNAIRNSFTS